MNDECTANGELQQRTATALRTGAVCRRRTLITAVTLFLTTLGATAFCAERFDDSVIVNGTPGLPCRVIGIGKDGKVTLRSACFEGDVLTSPRKVAALTLKRSADEKGRDVVLLTNGDYLTGAVTELSPKSVVMKNATLGVVRIPRSAVVELSFGQEGGSRLRSDFSSGVMGPCKPQAEGWQVKEGWLTSEDRTGPRFDMQLDQSEAMTYAFTVDFSATRTLYLTVLLFVDDKAGADGPDAVLVSFVGDRCTVRRVTNGKLSIVGSGRIPKAIQEKSVGDFQIAYDPRDGAVHIWGDGKRLGKHKMAKPVKAGKSIVFQPGRPMKFRAISAVPGFSGPPGTVMGEPATDKDMVTLRNGETRPLGQDSLKDAARIMLKTDAQQTPKPTPQDAIVRMHKSRITMVLGGMNADLVTGRSPILGDVKLKRATVTQITLPGTPAPMVGPHMLAFKDGPVLRGTVHGAEPGAALTATLPPFDGTVRIVRDRLACVSLPGLATEEPAGGVLLTNGDRILGELLAVTAESVRVKSALFGELSIPFKHVARVTLASGVAELSATDFAKGDVQPWRKTRDAPWKLVDGVLEGAMDSSIVLDHKLEGPVSLEVDLVWKGGAWPSFRIYMFSDDKKGGNSIQWSIYGARAVLYIVSGGYVGKAVFRSERNYVPITPESRFTFFYDPVDQIAGLAVNGEVIARGKLIAAPVAGRHIIITSRGRTHLRGMRLFAGADLFAEEDGEDERHVILLPGDDRLTVNALTAADGKATVKTAFGEQTFPLENARAFIFPRTGRADVPPGDGVVRVRLRRTSISLAMKSLSDKALVGTTTYGAEVTVPREAIRCLEF